MPNRPADQIEAMEKWILAALKAGEDSPKAVLEWIAQNSSIKPPSLPKIAAVMREQGYEPAGYRWEKVRK